MKTKSEKLFAEAQQHIPGGVNSPVRAFKQVGGTPVFMESARGAYMYDVDGNEYIDYINSWGPMILGHQHPKVVAALKAEADKAFSFGAPCVLEIEMARLIKQMVPNIDLVRMVSSGTEACMSAIRLARGFTGKSKFIKFEGHYHGHADMLLKKSGSGVATLGIKQEGGIPLAVTNDTIILPFNNAALLQQTIEENKDELAALILEPVAGNMGCVPPAPGFLQLARELCTKHNMVLIFDEVMTGFRLSSGGAQKHFDIWADLVTLGKVIGGGMPVGAFGGRKDIMSCIAPLGTVYQAGTLSGNPLAMAAGYATLNELHANPSVYTELDKKGAFLEKGIAQALTGNKIKHVINRLGSMISVHFCDSPVTDFASAAAGNNETFKNFFHYLLNNGIYLPPSAFESWFLCEALTQADLDKTVRVIGQFKG
jgi:glutamate-1-semialdehyde 2,1-aminomutase